MDAPPLLVSFESTAKLIQAMNLDSSEVEAIEINELASKNLPPVISRTNVAVLFGYSPKFVGAIIKNPTKYYRTFTIPKGSTKRTIDAPKVALKVIQKWLSFHLSHNLEFPGSVVGFVPNRSAISGAAMHCGAKWVFSTDIVDFFQSINVLQVRNALLSLGYPEHGAAVITQLACLRGFLAQGSPCSPVLSNLVSKDLDMRIQEYADANNLRYTRYADDIAISGTDSPPAEVESFVRQEVTRMGWTISEDKTELIHLPKRLKVYGLLVHGERPRLTKGYRNRIRAIKHLKENDNLEPELLIQALGHLAYADSVENWEPDF